MTLDQFSRAIRRQPFTPFTMVLADGRSFTVDHPEFASIDRRGREVTFNDRDGRTNLLEALLIADIVFADADHVMAGPEPAAGNS